MLGSGYVKMHRSIVNWEWYDKPNTYRLFTHLIYTVNWKDENWHGIIIKKGQRASSYSKIAKELNLSEKNIRTAMKHLKKTGEVAHHTIANCGIFTVVNYEKFQEGADETADKGQTSGREGADERQQMNKANKANKDNKAKKNKKGGESAADFSAFLDSILEGDDAE